ncbi:MAG: NAD(P)-dependent oxidoreductase [Marivita sp.]|uniref:NAD-dependent epimerase/dehydratase family protein n=1 Tax=Marivita sp. TaxID=2003365 RepID=UPI0025B8CBAE|nr:NAD(P)-dependent oxidoreductase [Marivita sp.]MCI5112140.1 NAD(P)-dependent oxidoreductase [Marivita sp.]
MSGIGPVLVTGGGGFLGRALTARLLDAGETVVTLDLKAAQGDARATHLAGDIRDSAAVTTIAETHAIRAIVHLAALVIPACRDTPALGAEVNVIGHLNMLDVARRLGIGRFLYTSSIAARPRPPHDGPHNLYGVWKRACEEASKVYFLDHGLPSVGLRPNVVYGPGREVGETAAITLAIKAAAEGHPYTMPFASRMCFQHVDEVTEIMMRCLHATPDGPVVSDLTTQVESTDDVIAAILALAPDARITPSKTLRPSPPELDNGPLLRLIGTWPGVSLAEGVRRTFDHYQARLG